ncbi:Protein R08A2.7 [Aphelenchoides avenae]|nr:Protein R08A2.7 [Aphelenchus avenae]
MTLSAVAPKAHLTKQTSLNVPYSDEFCELTTNALIVRSFDIPLAKSKKIPISDIEVIWYQKQCFDPWKCKEWGMAPSSIYWALDNQRLAKSQGRFNVVLETDSLVKVGFTVADIVSFMDNMQKITSGNVQINPGALP